MANQRRGSESQRPVSHCPSYFPSASRTRTKMYHAGKKSKYTAWILFGLVLLLSKGGATRRTQLAKAPKETNVFNFVRLLVMRLVYGVASMMGFSEGISEFAGGALVPPGADDDYLDYDREYDDDYDY